LSWYWENADSGLSSRPPLQVLFPTMAPIGFKSSLFENLEKLHYVDSTYLKLYSRLTHSCYYFLWVVQIFN